MNVCLQFKSVKLRETMTEVEENVLPPKFFDNNSVLHEYESISASLKEELNMCKVEQTKLRLEIKTIQEENRNANEALHASLTECNHGNCQIVEEHKEVLTNLEKRITIMQMEKDSTYQLWQMALKIIDCLEEELRNINRDDKSTKFYQEQIVNIKEAYSEAIKVLESKLVSAKETFFQQQARSEKNKEMIEQLTKEKTNISQQLTICQQQFSEKDKIQQATIDSLKEDFNSTKCELEFIKQSKIDLELKLKEAQTIVSNMMKRENEAKLKVSEAVELIESVMKEKNVILKREARVVEEKIKLEKNIAKLSDENANRLDTEITKIKEMYNKNIKKYQLEIKELKAELREKITALDRTERERRLAEEELEKVKQDSNNFIHNSHARILNLEQSLQPRDSRLQINESGQKTINNDRILDLETQISRLQEKLSSTTETLRRVQFQNSRDVEDQIREADSRKREIMEKCSNFERQLSRSITDKENLACQLYNLESSFQKELQKRNHEKLLLEIKVRDLQEKISNAENFPNGPTTVVNNLPIRRDTSQQTMVHYDPLTNIIALQEKYDKKTNELIQHVETHQKLSNKWKEEANSLTEKFQKRTQDFKSKINILQKQNNDLARELLFYQQLLARCNAQIVQKFTTDTETR
ncbi:uncharacterized protein LOC131664373 [Phymastichus coffea]|uniref:uncharacterized protein LOC131664373 n=1 Tax=Phymastichus coffea TaxID=108790 RepID=UPI00273ADAC1|nr:uncharacterized protein LOC131664373 [Phymastichus coffea]